MPARVHLQDFFKKVICSLSKGSSQEMVSSIPDRLWGVKKIVLKGEGAPCQAEECKKVWNSKSLCSRQCAWHAKRVDSIV